MSFLNFDPRNAFLVIIFALSSFNNVFSQCPTTGAVVTKIHTDISCFGANDGTITVELGDGDAPLNFELWDNNLGSFVTLTVTENEDPDEDGNFRKVTYSNVYASSFQVVVFKSGCPTISVSENFSGTVVLEPTAVAVSNLAAPDCDPNPGVGNGSIELTISGGTAPYDIAWPVAATPIADVNDVPSGTYLFSNLDGGNYTFEIRDANNCLFTDDVTVRITTLAAAGDDQTVCGPSANLNANAPAAGETGTWTGPPGVTFSPEANTPNAVADNLPLGVNILVWTISDNTSTCGDVSDQVEITSDDPATADAGLVQSVCEGSTVSLIGSVGGTATSGTWTSSGNGSFDDPGSLTAIYTPGSDDLAAGTVTLTLTTEDPAGPCVSVSDDVVITIEDGATVDAGADQTICADGTAGMSGSIGGAATTGTWSSSGDGSFDDVGSETAVYTPGPNDIINGTVTLTFTTDDPVGPCTPIADDVIITITAAATVDADGPAVICVGQTANVTSTFTATSGVTWSSSGDGFFDDPSMANAVYTPGATDITNGSVTLTATTLGPCLPVSDDLVVNINAVATVDAGMPQTICSNASIVLNASFGGSATGLTWTTSGDGSFDDVTDPNATYTPGVNDITNESVTLTASATGSCSGVTDDVVITINPAASVDAGEPQTLCHGNDVTLSATLEGSATSMTWTTSGDGSFDNITEPAAIYTPGANDEINGTVTLTATTNNPVGPCPAAVDDVVITLIPIPGDQTTAGDETWIGYVYDDSGDPTPIPDKIDFNNGKYRGFITETDIPAMSTASTYNSGTDAFDLNLDITTPLQGANLCAPYLNNFSVRYLMNKTFSAGVYRFTAGADDGVRLLVDGVNVLLASAFDFQSYTAYTSAPVCLTGGIHQLEIHYFDNTAQSRLTFDYEEVPDLTTSSLVSVCIDAPAPALSVSSTDPDVLDFNWYKGGVLVFTGDEYTPAAGELDMTVAGTTNFAVTAIYSCGETQPVTVTVEVLNSATLTLVPQTICESGGVVDLLTFVDAVPSGGTFTFSGHPNISGNNFDPAGLAGSTVSVLVDYSIGSCSAPQGTLELTITNTASTTVPASSPVVCESSPVIDLTTYVSANPVGGTFTFSGPQVTGSSFDPSGLSGPQTITVDYTVGGCIAPQSSFDIEVTGTASLTINNTAACEDASPVDLLTLVSATPGGGTFVFTGTGVSGNLFDPSGLSGTISISVDYDMAGCTDNGTLQIEVLDSSDPICTGGNCASVVIVPKTEPATCTNSDGRLVMSIDPFTPAVNNTGVRITIDGTSSTGLPITYTIHNDSIFENLPVGAYNYSIEYGDPSCIKTGTFSIDQSGTVGTPVVSNVVSPACFGASTGSLTLDVPGETGNILEWSLDAGLEDPFKPFTAGSQISGLPAGPAPTYQHVISVRRNISDVCYSSVTVTMPESVSPITATFDITPATCDGNDGAITNISASGGNDAPFTYSIDGGQTFQSSTDFNGLSGGTYTLTVRDAAGCDADFDADVTFPGFINYDITKKDGDCSNGGQSGSITVTVNDPGTFEVALTSDQFNPPADTEYRPYSNPSVTFSDLPRGEYLVYVRSGSGICPTRSALITIFGVYDITFDLQPDCNNNELSLALLNVTGEVNGAPLEIQVSRALSSDPPEIIYQQFPADGEVYLDHALYSFLQIPGEYRLKVIQFQSEAVCNMPSETVDFTVSDPLTAQIGSVSESYPDIPTGQLNVSAFSGGVFPFDVRIELDSAASFSLPYHVTEFEEAGLNGNQQIEMAYNNVPAGRYHVEVMDAQGCILDLIARVPLDVDLFIPNVFTPNGDGSNDIFFIRNLPLEPAANELIITNRWGKQVFASENYQNNWEAEGTADGIYFYRLQISDKDALMGWVEIIRGQKP